MRIHSSLSLALSLSVLPACSAPGHHPTDHNPSTDASGTSDTDTAPSLVSVQVVGAPDAHVVFLDGDDGEIATEAVDDQGNASAVVPDGGSASVVLPAEGDEDDIGSAYTFLGVHPGDRFVMTARPTTTFTQTSITLPAYEGTQVYRVLGDCGAEAESVTTSATAEVPPCDSATTDLLVIALGYTGDWIASFEVDGVTLGATLDLSDQTYTSLLPVTVNMTHVDPSASDFYFTSTFLFHGAPDEYGQGAPGTLSGSTYTSVVDMPPSTGSLLLDAYLSNDGDARQVIRQRVPFGGTDAPITVDLSTIGVLKLADPTFDASTGLAHWTETGAGTADMVIANLIVDHEAGGSFTRNVAAVHSGTSVHVPTLPAPFDNLNVLATDTVAPRISVYDLPEHAAAFHLAPFDHADDSGWIQDGDVLGVDSD